MIPSFKYPDTCALFQGKQAARFVNSERVALRKLRQLEIAASLNDLRAQVAHDTKVAKEKMRDILTRIRPLEHA